MVAYEALQFSWCTYSLHHVREIVKEMMNAVLFSSHPGETYHPSLVGDVLIKLLGFEKDTHFFKSNINVNDKWSMCWICWFFPDHVRGRKLVRKVPCLISRCCCDFCLPEFISAGFQPWHGGSSCEHFCVCMLSKPSSASQVLVSPFCMQTYRHAVKSSNLITAVSIFQ